MAEETITFELIRRIQREELRVQKLTKIPENFYKSVNDYLFQKRQMTLKDDRKVVLEMKQIERLIEDIFNRRERKILNAAIISARSHGQPENLLEEEKKFFDSVVGLIKNRRNENIMRVLESESGEKETLIIFKEEVPEFVGSDLKTYGPFKKGDIAKLPEDNMRILIERGIVEEFKVSK